MDHGKEYGLPRRSEAVDANRSAGSGKVKPAYPERLASGGVRGLPPGVQETIPIVHQGVMYVVAPGAAVQALDAANGDLIWEYKRKLPDDLKAAVTARTKGLAIFEDMIYYTAPDGYVVALDAQRVEGSTREQCNLRLCASLTRKGPHSVSQTISTQTIGTQLLFYSATR